jgi:SAM-dependent methyltransferase
MLRDGWAGKIVNVDFSKVVVAQMQAKYDDKFYENLLSNIGGGGYKKKGHSSVNKMEFLCADITKPLPFDDGSFDLIVCKGSFDAVLCSQGSRANIRSLVQQCARLLAPGHGIFFLVTNGNPDNRLEFLEYENQLNHYWHGVGVHPLPKRSMNQTQPSPRAEFVPYEKYV